MSPVSGTGPRLLTMTSKTTFCPTADDAGDLTSTGKPLRRGDGAAPAGGGGAGKDAVPGKGASDGPVTFGPGGAPGIVVGSVVEGVTTGGSAPGGGLTSPSSRVRKLVLA